MATYETIHTQLESASVRAQLSELYGSLPSTVDAQVKRYQKVLQRHENLFHTQRDVSLISAPGRMEIGGNHTDHNHGLVLAASASLDTLCAVSPRDDMVVELRSEGYPAITVNLAHLEAVPSEEGTTTALIRGVAARMKEKGFRIGGFEATVQSTVVSGSGLSSSAAFEVMTVAIFDHLYNQGSMDFKLAAQISQYAENQYFGKPSGLLDQMASAAGGLVGVDFADADPKVEPMHFDFSDKGYQIVVVNTHGSHADLTPDYAAIPKEMKQVAGFFGKSFLRDVDEKAFTDGIADMRGKVPDRAILRAIHFYQENHRVTGQKEALRRGDIQAFFDAIIASGRSSFMYLQNVYARVNKQELSLALALAEEMLQGKGAWRVHGGGFAGTTLNFVPDTLLDTFTETMNAVFGKDSCYVLKIRPRGAVKLTLA